tara:strand:- start:1228 stop:1428 length:201 start_codon:yes stop_codon:yes gene_type:complete
MLKSELEQQLVTTELRYRNLERDYEELKRKYKRLELRNCYLKHLETKLVLFQKEIESLSKLRRELT